MHAARARFTPSESISGQSQAKSSVQRNIRKAILETLPLLEPHIDELLPKKLPVYVAKCQQPSHTNLILVNKEPLFIQLRDSHYLPTLRLLHRYPDIMPRVQVDRGAIKYVLKGADVMCPGLTSAGGRLDVELGSDVAVAIQAEGKEHAVAIGILKLSTADMSVTQPHTARHCTALTPASNRTHRTRHTLSAAHRTHTQRSRHTSHTVALCVCVYVCVDSKEVNKGTGIETVHFLNDGLWQITTLE